MQVHWHLRITLESSSVDRAKELAKAERRTVSNYVAALIEQAQKDNIDGNQGRNAEATQQGV